MSQGKGFFEIRDRHTGKSLSYMNSFNKREDGKKYRDAMNEAFYGKGKVPQYGRRYYIARSKYHRNGQSR